MTILVGVRCIDGIVIGADSMTTSAIGPAPLVQVPEGDKLQLIGDTGILACSGAVGLGQRVKLIADGMAKEKLFKDGTMRSASVLAGLVLEDFDATRVPRRPHEGLNFGALLGMVVDDEHCLVEFATSDFQPELKEGQSFYVAMGSGQLLAEPFLAFVKRVLWKDRMPDVERAKIGVFWTLNHTAQLAAGGVGGALKLGVIKKTDGQWTASLHDIQEQAQFIEELESRICLNEPFETAPSSPPPPELDR